MECVYCAVQNELLYIIHANLSFERVNGRLQICRNVQAAQLQNSSYKPAECFLNQVKNVSDAFVRKDPFNRR
jgi:hypothetical protein